MICGKCGLLHGVERWTKAELHRHRHNGSVAICQECRGMGYHPRNTRAYTCGSCNKNYGSKMFLRKDLINFSKTGQQVALYCRRCALQLECAWCSKSFDKEHWTYEMQENHKYHGAPLICQECRSLGFRRQGQHSMTCSEARDSLLCSRCMKPYERAFWSSSERDRHQKLGTSLVCKHCRRLGFHPRDLQGYTCQRCRGTFAARRFSSV